MDRLFRYEFSDPQLHIAIEFFKSVFNRADVTYHLEENHVTRPVSISDPLNFVFIAARAFQVFVAIIAVRSDYWGKGIGSGLLEAWLVHSSNEFLAILFRFETTRKNKVHVQRNLY